MNNSVIYTIALFQAIVFSIYADNVVLSYCNVKEEDRIHIEEGIRAIFPHQMVSGKVKLLLGGASGDGLYVVETESLKFVFRCMKQPHSIQLCQKDCIYSQMAAEKRLAPKVLYQNIEKGCYATEFVEGPRLSPVHLEDLSILEQFAQALRAIHDTPMDSSIKFDIFERIEQKIESNIQKNPEFSLELNVCLDAVHKIKTVIKKHTIAPKTCHNDIHMMNLFYTPENAIKFIDWGNAGLGDPFWDLACASVKLHFSKDQVDYFLEKYFENGTSFDHAHFILMKNIALFEIGLHFLGMKQNILDESVKAAVLNYLRKTNEEVINSIDTFEDAAKICFTLFKKGIRSEESRKAFSLLEQL